MIMHRNVNFRSEVDDKRILVGKFVDVSNHRRSHAESSAEANLVPTLWEGQIILALFFGLPRELV
jgi:hypothetical protein